MRYLALDTSIYRTCLATRVNGHTPALLNKVRRFNHRRGDSLLVPEVVEAELHRHLSRTKHHAEVASFISSEGIERLPLTADALVRAMIWSIRGDRPARVSDEQSGTILSELGDAYYKYGAEQDCLILSTLSEFMSGKPDDSLVICTGDKRWFQNGELVESITSEFACKVTGYRELTVLLQEEFDAEVSSEVAEQYARAALSLDALQSFSGTFAIALGALPKFDMPSLLGSDTLRAIEAFNLRNQAQIAETMKVISNSGVFDWLESNRRQLEQASLAATRIYGSGMMKVLQDMEAQNARIARLVMELPDTDDDAGESVEDEANDRETGETHQEDDEESHQ